MKSNYLFLKIDRFDFYFAILPSLSISSFEGCTILEGYMAKKEKKEKEHVDN